MANTSATPMEGGAGDLSMFLQLKTPLYLTPTEEEGLQAGKHPFGWHATDRGVTRWKPCCNNRNPGWKLPAVNFSIKHWSKVGMGSPSCVFNSR